MARIELHKKREAGCRVSLDADYIVAVRESGSPSPDAGTIVEYDLEGGTGCVEVEESYQDVLDQLADAKSETGRRESGQGAAFIAMERWKHEAEKGYGPSHDDAHSNRELVWAAAELLAAYLDTGDPVTDEWGLVAKTRGLPLKRLRVAGSLIAAEIDRRLRRMDD